MSIRLARAACFSQPRFTAPLIRSSPSSLRRLSYTPSNLAGLPPSSSTIKGATSTSVPSSNPTSLPSSSSPSPSSSIPELNSSTGRSCWTAPLIFASLVVLVGVASQTASFLEPAHADEPTKPDVPLTAQPSEFSPNDAEAAILPTSPIYKELVAYVKSLQETITSSIEKLEEEATPSSLFSNAPPSARFLHDSWIRPNNGGEGISCVIKGGTVLEKGGVNISIIQGLLPPRAVAQMRADHAGLEHVDTTKSLPYAVVGLSIVLHPNNPLAPTCHFNIRYFEIYDDKDLTKPVASWFGGGSDLTPNYLFEEDAVHFHSTLKTACDKHGESYYPAFKPWCDKYFYIPHRGEARGVGGIFFDDLDSSSEIHKKSLKYSSGIGPEPREILEFVKELGDAFVPSYLPILKKRHAMKFTEEQKRWQQLRRGRYVEFNLVNDRGTKFGLMTPGARIESVLMSLPETARWEYMFEVQKGSEEEKMMDVLKTPRNWV